MKSNVLKISHRGNLFDIKHAEENKPDYINNALKNGFDVEIDVWKIGNDILLGHDEPQYEIDTQFLKNKHFWCHAKNLDALNFMIQNNIQCFWHQNDDFTLTSSNIIWTFPKMKITNNSIIVCQTYEDTLHYYNTDIFGICSDYVGLLK